MVYTCLHDLGKVYLGRWRAILSGDVLRWFPRLTRTDESYVLALLQHHRLPISRFPSVAALGCCFAHCFQSACFKRAFPLRGAMGELLRHHAALATRADLHNLHNLHSLHNLSKAAALAFEFRRRALYIYILTMATLTTSLLLTMAILTTS